MAPVLAAMRGTNAELIAACAELGYLRAGWLTLDPTYGRGGWWRRWRPERLVAHDLALDGVDFRRLPEAGASIDAVAFDPPYRLNGTPDRGEFDARYGTGTTARWQERHALIRAGISEAVRVLRPGGILLVKCADQVCSGRVRWQTREFAAHAEAAGCELIDQLHLLASPRPQPPGRRQAHARRNLSTLLVLRKI
jgi:hypothetical protein